MMSKKYIWVCKTCQKFEHLNYKAYFHRKNYGTGNCMSCAQIERKADTYSNLPTWNKGLNISGMSGKKQSEYQKKRMSELHNIPGYFTTPEGIEKMKLAKLGKPGLNKGKTWKVAKEKLINFGSYCGEKHHNWKGGISNANHQVRRLVAYKEWRESVFERDDYTCKDCKVKGGKLEAHHIKKFSEFIDLRFDVNNGVTLCKACHRLIFGREEEVESKYISMVGA